MTNQLLEEDRVIAELEQAFSVNKMILFVGAEDVEGVLTKEIACLPWSCIITTSRKEDFLESFSDQQRRVRELCSVADIGTNMFEANSLPIIKLYGGESRTVLDEDDYEMIQDEIEDECNKMLSSVMRRLDFTMQLVFIGYHPGAKDELKRTTLLLRLKECAGPRILFFGLHYDDEETLKLKSSLNKMDIVYYDELLSNMLLRQDFRSESHNAASEDDDKELFYKNGKGISIKKRDVLRYKEIGALLTERLVHEIRPFGRIQQSRWFLNFLTRSSIDGPQWYGYLKQSEFYLQRSFESAFFRLIDNVLKGKEGVVKDYSIPVILEGDPTSSKSIELGALAYRTFIAKENPVIYIFNNRLDTQEDIDALDELMQEVECHGDSDPKTLVIWDGASYQNIGKMARNIAKRLDNRGRRFLFVCSAYRNLDYSNEASCDKYRFFRQQGEDIVECKQNEMELYQDVSNGCYYVHASGELNTKELAELKNKVKLYTPELKGLISTKWDTLEKEGNKRLFDYLHKLLVVLQPPLEMGLDRERKKFVQFAQKQFAKEGTSIKIEQDDQIRNALIDAGFTIEELNEIESKDDLISEEDIQRMNTCIAMFSRFKLDCPVRMAIYILRLSSGENAYMEIYSAESRKLCDTILSSMPWILYKPNADGVFCFYYRSALEAEIYLTNSNITPENEIDMICAMLDFYADDFGRNNSADFSLKYSLKKIIRMIGPNSEYFSFLRNSGCEHKGLLEHMDKIIDKLSWLRETVKVEDDDASFANIEITFLREFYGSLWNGDKIKEVKNSVLAGNECKLWDAYPEIFTENSYCHRLQMLEQAVYLANDSIDRLQRASVNGREKQSYASTINALTVELSRCTIKIEELQNEYLDLCKCKDINPRAEVKEIRLTSYMSLYRMLMKAIHSDPLNGYSYNAIFALFIKEYEKADNGKRYELLSGIRSIVDDAETYDIENRGPAERDELTKHISTIRNYSSNVKVSIESLDSRRVDKAFLNLFDDMLERGNASVLTFVCQQELDNAGLTKFKRIDLESGVSIRNQLNADQIKKCREICEFMNREEYATCIEEDANALFLLLRVTWMAYNGYPIMDGNGECRRTYLSKTEWIEISRLCNLYESRAGNAKRPIVVLLHALSVIQISGDYQEANRILETMGEEMFFASPRMRVPYLLCNEDGTPQKFTGTIIQTDDQRHRGQIKVDKVPLQLGTKTGVRFYQKNLGQKSMPKVRDVMYNLEMGIGYMGFSMYTENGRSRLEVK